MTYLTYFWPRAWLPTTNPPMPLATDPFCHGHLTYG